MYPDDYVPSPHCKLVLWMADLGGPPWTIGEIYNRPMLSTGGNVGVLDTLLLSRLPLATAAGYINAANEARAIRAINRYIGAPDAFAGRSMADLFRAGKWQGVGAPAPVDAIEQLMQELCASGVYFPPNHPVSDLASIGAVLGTIFGQPFPNPAGGPDTTFGNITFQELFATSLRLLYDSYRPAFDDIQLGKKTGVLRPERDFCGDPLDLEVGPIGIVTTKNNRCCNPATNTCGAGIGYCNSTTGVPTDPCNAMSDWC